LWSLDDGRMIREFTACEGHAHRVFFLADGQTLLTSGEEGRVRFWNATTGASAGEIGGFSDDVHGGVERALACSPDRQRIAVGHGKSSAYLFDTVTLDQKCKLQGLKGDSVRTFRYSSDGAILAGAMRSKRIFLWRTADGELLD